MKSNIKSKRNSKPKILAVAIVLSILILIIVGTSVVINYLQNKSIKPQTTSNPGNVVIIDNNPPTTDQKAAGDAQKPNDTVANNELGISITSINTQVNPISIRSVISGATTNNGTCKLILTKGLSVVTKTSDTYALPSTSTCKDFNINKSELSTGTWQVELTVTISGKESVIKDSLTLE